jgi:hypothetical protein
MKFEEDMSLKWENTERYLCSTGMLRRVFLAEKDFNNEMDRLIQFMDRNHPLIPILL